MAVQYPSTDGDRTVSGSRQADQTTHTHTFVRDWALSLTLTQNTRTHFTMTFSHRLLSSVRLPRCERNPLHLTLENPSLAHNMQASPALTCILDTA